MSLDLDVTYIIVLALFLVPVVFLNGIVFKPFMALFEERHERLEGAVERATGWSASLEPWAVLLAVGFAGLVGVFFGYYPARRAARLQPIVALRHE